MLDAELVGEFGRDFDEGFRLQLGRVRHDPRRDAATVEFGEPISRENVREPTIAGWMQFVAGTLP